MWVLVLVVLTVGDGSFASAPKTFLTEIECNKERHIAEENVPKKIPIGTGSIRVLVEITDHVTKCIYVPTRKDV